MVALHELVIELFSTNGTLMVLTFPYGKLNLVGKSTEVEEMQLGKEKFIVAVRKFMQMDKLTAPLLRELVDRIDVYEVTGTGKYFRDVLEMARHEDIDSTTLASLEALLPQLQPSFREAIYRNLDEVKSLLGSEIILRYYYQRGQAAYQLRFDDELKRALSECKHLMAEKQ